MTEKLPVTPARDGEVIPPCKLSDKEIILRICLDLQKAEQGNGIVLEGVPDQQQSDFEDLSNLPVANEYILDRQESDLQQPLTDTFKIAPSSLVKREKKTIGSRPPILTFQPK